MPTIDRPRELHIAFDSRTMQAHLSCAELFDEFRIQEIGDYLMELVNANRNHLVLNLAGVDFVSSAALGKLIILDKHCEAHGGKLELHGVGPQLQQTLTLIDAVHRFEVMPLD